jgi:hypothetical protein
MRIKAKPLLALRTWVILTFILVWNGVCLLALGLNGWHGQLREGPGLWVAVTQLACTSTLALVIVLIPRVREALTDPQRRELYEPTPFVFIALITAVMAVVFAMPK